MRPLILTLLAIVALPTAAAPSTTDWAGWRGPTRDGKLAGFPTPKPWPDQLTKRWSIDVGEGHSSPIVAGEKAYVFVRRDEKEVVMRLDLATGRTEWEHSEPAPFDSVIFPARRLGKSPRSTPLYVDGKLYVIGINGTLTCLRAESGKVIWRRDFATDHRLPMPICGASLSPLVDGKRLYVHAGHDAEGALYALDRETGAEIWRTPTEGPGYTSPQVTEINGTRMLITAAHNSWVGFDVADGKLLWSLSVRQNMFNHNSITPIVVGDIIYGGANQRPSFAMKVVRGDAGWSVQRIWETRDVTLSTSNPLVGDDRVYMVNEKRRGQVTVLNRADGQVLWTCAGSKGEHVTLYDAGSQILCFTSNGELVVYEKVAEGLREIAKYEVADGTMWSSPAVSGNRLLVKGAQTLTLWEIATP